jgi:hypothetical protein
MKKILNSIYVLSVIFTLTSCVADDDTALPTLNQPIFAQNFESEDTGVITLPGWSNVSLNGGAKWEVRSFSNQKYAQLSAFGSGESNMDTWLVTDSINLNLKENPILRFSYKAAHHNGNALSVLVSSDYNGENTVEAINAANWTDMNVILPDYSTNSYPDNFSLSDAIDLSSFEGKIHIAFRYVGSSTGVTTTYQVDNINVY